MGVSKRGPIWHPRCVGVCRAGGHARVERKAQVRRGQERPGRRGRGNHTHNHDCTRTHTLSPRTLFTHTPARRGRAREPSCPAAFPHSSASKKPATELCTKRGLAWPTEIGATIYGHIFGRMSPALHLVERHQPTHTKPRTHDASLPHPRPESKQSLTGTCRRRTSRLFSGSGSSTPPSSFTCSFPK